MNLAKIRCYGSNLKNEMVKAFNENPTDIISVKYGMKVFFERVFVREIMELLNFSLLHKMMSKTKLDLPSPICFLNIDGW